MKKELLTKLSGLNEAELYKSLFCDCLTNILNRRAFDESKSTKYVALVDLDSLKYVNDNLGHRAGDAQLCAMASGLTSAFDSEDVYRLSGDEFVVRSDSMVEMYVKLNQLRARLPGFSYGLGKDLVEADEQLILEKQAREAAGIRAPRGDTPPWVLPSNPKAATNYPGPDLVKPNPIPVAEFEVGDRVKYAAFNDGHCIIEILSGDGRAFIRFNNGVTQYVSVKHLRKMVSPDTDTKFEGITITALHNGRLVTDADSRRFQVKDEKLRIEE